MLVYNPIFILFRPQQTVEHILDACAGLKAGNVHIRSFTAGNIEQS